MIVLVQFVSKQVIGEISTPISSRSEVRLKAACTTAFKDKVKGKSIPAQALARVCGRLQSTESDDKCTATLDTILHGETGLLL